jgi:oligopeptide transport system ATP-binding protein
VSEPLIRVESLTKHFPVRQGVLGRTVAHVHAVDEVSFTIPRGETVALVGESGCGKTTTGRTLLRLISPTSGHVDFDGEPVFRLANRELRSLRKRMQIIFQDPQSSLNPRMTVGDIVGEGVRIHEKPDQDRIQTRVAELLDLVELPEVAAGRYPHEFSGGQRQRIGIARALSTGPDFLLCDEAVSALDVSIQAQVINLLMDLQQRLGLTYLFIAHDLAVVRHISSRILVMYLGHLVEDAPTEALFAKPLHPYTEALLASIPEPRPGHKEGRSVIPGDVPSPVSPPPGCRFHTRCPKAMDACRSGEIPTYVPEPGRRVKCILYEGSPTED